MQPLESSEEAAIRVLLIEDDERLAHLTARYLGLHQVIVHIESDGRSGLSEALCTRYDVVLLDLMLPGHEGRMQVASQPGLGTTVTMVLPRLPT